MNTVTIPDLLRFSVLPALFLTLPFAPPPQDLSDDPARTNLASAEAARTGSGAWMDLDADGRAEGLLLRPSGELRVVSLDSEGTLLDRTEELGLELLPPVRSAHWQDPDGDQALDLLVVTLAGDARLLRNEGDGFADVTLGSGLEGLHGLRGATWRDLDSDGLAELVLESEAGLRSMRAIEPFRFEFAGPVLPAASWFPVLSGARGETLANEVDPPAAGVRPEEESVSLEGSQWLASAPRGAASSGNSVSGTTNGSGAPLAAPSGKMASTLCAGSIRDMATNACLTASSTPQLGSLYPITSDLYVDPATGHVGVGTTNPLARLAVSADGTQGIFVGTNTAGPSVALFSSPNTSPSAPTVLAYAGDGGTSGFFEEKLSIGGTTFGFPLVRGTLGIDSNSNAELLLNNSSNVQTVDLVTEEGAGNGAQLELRMNDGTTTFSLDAEAGSVASELSMFNRNGTETVEILSQEASGNGAQLVLRKDNGVATMVLDAETSVACEVSLRNSSGQETIEMLSEEISGDGAQIILRKDDGTASIILDAEQGTNGRITTETLEITGGADLVESFRTSADCVAGTVLSIDPDRPGELEPSTEAYDRRVAGIVSGAGGVRPGLHLGQRGLFDGDTPVALTGRVYVRCTDEGGVIQPGDLLTTSSTVGCAMRAEDVDRRAGAVIGKAMSSLSADEGLVLVLVSLQ